VILTVKCGTSLAALTCGTVAAYMAFTFGVTQVVAGGDSVQLLLKKKCTPLLCHIYI
jgi:hypothetical protein